MNITVINKVKGKRNQALALPNITEVGTDDNSRVGIKTDRENWNPGR